MQWSGVGERRVAACSGTVQRSRVRAAPPLCAAHESSLLATGRQIEQWQKRGRREGGRELHSYRSALSKAKCRT